MHSILPEHLGLIRPQMPNGNPHLDDFMKPAPWPNPDETSEYEDRLVADPMAVETDRLWKETAHKNREIFGEIFRTVPTNIVRNWKSYDVR